MTVQRRFSRDPENLPTLSGILKIKLHLLLAIIIVFVPVVFAIVETSICVAPKHNSLAVGYDRTSSAEIHLLLLACFVIVGVLAVAILPHHLAVVLLGFHLALEVSLHKQAHVNNVVGTVGATGAAVTGGAKFEVDETLLVHSVEVLAIIATFFATKVSTCRPTKQEEDRIMSNADLRQRNISWRHLP